MLRGIDEAKTAIARWGAHALETGAFSGTTSRMLARAHATFARSHVARPLVLPGSFVTVTVGGATLGGSGKTRVALACAKELLRLGANVVLVGHAYRATPRYARVVSSSDRVSDVGDEALVCARELRAVAGERARVVVGPDRQSAIDLVVAASPRADAVVIDGPLQLAPVRSSLSVLAVDAELPWGAGDVPPAGDLRAPRAALLAHADHVVSVDATPLAIGELAASLAGLRIGLFTALGRPDRLVRALAGAGVMPSHVARAADHGPISPRLAREIRSSDVDIWLATAKCAVHLEVMRLPARLAILDGSLILPPALTSALSGLRVGARANQAGVA